MEMCQCSASIEHIISNFNKALTPIKVLGMQFYHVKGSCYLKGFCAVVFGF